MWDWVARSYGALETIAKVVGVFAALLAVLSFAASFKPLREAPAKLDAKPKAKPLPPPNRTSRAAYGATKPTLGSQATASSTIDADRTRIDNKLWLTI